LNNSLKDLVSLNSVYKFTYDDVIQKMDYTAVSQATRRFEDKIRNDNKIRIIVNSVLELLKN